MVMAIVGGTYVIVTLTGDFPICLGGARMTWTITLVGCIEHSRDNFSVDSLQRILDICRFRGDSTCATLFLKQLDSISRISRSCPLYSRRMRLRSPTLKHSGTNCPPIPLYARISMRPRSESAAIGAAARFWSVLGVRSTRGEDVFRSFALTAPRKSARRYIFE